MNFNQPGPGPRDLPIGFALGYLKTDYPLLCSRISDMQQEVDSLRRDVNRLKRFVWWIIMVAAAGFAMASMLEYRESQRVEPLSAESIRWMVQSEIEKARLEGDSKLIFPLNHVPTR